MAIISPKAIVENPANLADDVEVGAFTFIGGDVKISSGCRIDNNVSIGGDVTLSEGVHVYPYAVIGSQSDAEKTGEIIIGGECTVREHAVISAASTKDKRTVLGKKNLIMTGCYIGPDVTVGNGIVLGNYSSYGKGAVIEDFVWSAAFTGVDENVRIGRYSFTSGYAGINSDAPPFAMLQGFPFKIRGVNTLNLKRRGFSEEEIEQLKEAFKLLFTRRMEFSAAVKEVQSWVASEHLDYLLKFISEHPHITQDPQE